MTAERSSRSETSAATSTEVSQLHKIREAILETPAEDLEHHLPNLIETVRSASTEDVETIRFHIGISFSQELTPLDYRIDQVVIPEGRDHTRIKSLKTAISRDHFYLSFPYPPDPDFSAMTFRGAMLAAVEHDIVYSNKPSVKSDVSSPSFLRTLRNWFG